MHGPRQVSIHPFSTVYSSVWVSMSIFGFINVQIYKYGPGGLRPAAIAYLVEMGFDETKSRCPSI